METIKASKSKILLYIFFINIGSISKIYSKVKLISKKIHAKDSGTNTLARRILVVTKRCKGFW